MKIDTAEIRDGFRFRGGVVVLDLAATLAARLKPEPRDLLQTPPDLARWLIAAGLANSAPDVRQDDLEKARALREAIYRVAIARIAGEGIPDEARRTINRIAAQLPTSMRLEKDGTVRIIGDTQALLTNIARDAVSLFGGASAERVRQCAGETCTLLFLDSSRKGERRWCSMAGCGNKAKVHAFRDRLREPRSPKI